MEKVELSIVPVSTHLHGWLFCGRENRSSSKGSRPAYELGDSSVQNTIQKNEGQKCETDEKPKRMTIEKGTATKKAQKEVIGVMESHQAQRERKFNDTH